MPYTCSTRITGQADLGALGQGYLGKVERQLMVYNLERPLGLQSRSFCFCFFHLYVPGGKYDVFPAVGMERTVSHLCGEDRKHLIGTCDSEGSQVQLHIYFSRSFPLLWTPILPPSHSGDYRSCRKEVVIPYALYSSCTPRLTSVRWVWELPAITFIFSSLLGSDSSGPGLLYEVLAITTAAPVDPCA